MPLMPSLVSHIYGSSGNNFNEKSERVTILAFKVTFGKFSFWQVKIHINAFKFHFGQNFLGPLCFKKYGCAEYRCPKRATGDTPYGPKTFLEWIFMHAPTCWNVFLLCTVNCFSKNRLLSNFNHHGVANSISGPLGVTFGHEIENLCGNHMLWEFCILWRKIFC